MDRLTDPPDEAVRKARQQAQLWSSAGDQACMRRQFIRGLRYYRQALELAERHHLMDLQGRLCRDLAYVYIHQGAPEEGLQLVRRGLALEGNDAELQLGLLVNKASALLALEEYPETHVAVREALRCFQKHYPQPQDIPPLLLSTYMALLKMEHDLRRIVELLRSGINPERIEVNVEFAPPFWLPPQKS